MDPPLAFKGQGDLVKEVNDKRSKDQKSFKNSTSGVYSVSTTAISDSKKLDNYSLCSESDWLDEKKDSNNAYSGPVYRDTVKEVRTLKAEITDWSRIDKTRIDESQTGAQANKTEESRTVEIRMEVNKAEEKMTDETRTGVNKTEESWTDETRTGANKTEANRLEENCDAKSSGTMYVGNLYPREIEGHDKHGPKVESSTPDVPLSVQESEEGRGSRSKLITGISPTTVLGGYGSKSIVITGIGSPIKELTFSV